MFWAMKSARYPTSRLSMTVVTTSSARPPARLAYSLKRFQVWRSSASVRGLRRNDSETAVSSSSSTLACRKGSVCHRRRSRARPRPSTITRTALGDSRRIWEMWEIVPTS